MKRLLAPTACAGTWSLAGPGFHHLIRVLRAQVGESVVLFDGAGRTFNATVLAIGDASAELTVDPPTAQALARPLSVLQGLPKADKLELVLQKGTELGVSAFWPVATAHSVVKLQPPNDAKLQRWQRIVDEAARQSGRSDVPLVHSPCPLLDAIRALPAGTCTLILDEAERNVPLAQAFSVASPAAPIALVVGPEGGLSRNEVAACQALGAIAVTLGRLVLRTETAALAAAVVLRHLDGWLG